jgi:hypothetical protein
MENKTKRGLIASGVILGIVAGLYFFVYKKVSTPKTLTELQNEVWAYLQKFNTNLIDAYKDSYINSEAFKDKTYMKAWYDAINSGADTFINNGLKFNTKDGSQV